MHYNGSVSVSENVAGIDLLEKWLPLSGGVQMTDINEALIPSIKCWCLLQLTSGLVSES